MRPVGPGEREFVWAHDATDAELERLLLDLEYSEVPEGSIERERADHTGVELAGFGGEFPEQALRIVAIAARLPLSQSTYFHIAASTLEDALDYHGASLIDRLEAMAMESEQVRLVLRGVWYYRVDPVIFNRVRAIVDRLGPHLEDDPWREPDAESRATMLGRLGK